jgi:hypothetical protein
MDYRDGDYRYPASRQALPPAGQGEHPYAAFSAAGYGDDGYSNPGYDGPASQDAGIAGTRTVRGFVEPGQRQAGYALPPAPQSGYAQPGYPPAAQPGYDYGQPGHSMPLPAETYPAADTRRQAWDYDQPLRYDDEEASYPVQDSYGSPGSYGQADRYDGRGYDSGAYHTPAYDPGQYNGSDYSMPGVDGPGYDLSGIIGTGDFEAFGYDEPSYDRLAYDDPRYDDNPGYGGSRYDAPRDDPRGGRRFDETRFDVPAFDETRLDNLWRGENDVPRDAPVGYGNDGFGGDSRGRSGYGDFDRPGNARFDETRMDLRLDRSTRYDMPVYDETRIDNMRAMAPAAATGLLAPPADRPLSWGEQTSLDAFSDLDLEEELAQAPAAFVRTAERGDDTAARRAVGRRRGRSGDRRQWMALGAIAVVAAGAIGGVLMKYVFHGPSGPAHTVVAPNQAGAFTRMPNLEKQMKVDELRQNVMQTSAGQATDVVSAVYQQGSSAPGSNPQIFMFVGGHLSNASPSASLASFEQHYPGAQVVPAGAMGGQAACAEAHSNGESVAMCVVFDNDSFGEFVSPTMTTAHLATTMDSVRPSLELYAK